MISTQTSNAMSEAILWGSATAAGWALIGGVIIGDPIGAAGGALFGATKYFSAYLLEKLGDKLFNANRPEANTAAVILAVALSLFGSIAVASAALSLAGFAVTLPHICSLGAISLLMNAANLILCAHVERDEQAAFNRFAGARIQAFAQEEGI